MNPRKAGAFTGPVSAHSVLRRRLCPCWCRRTVTASVHNLAPYLLLDATDEPIAEPSAGRKPTRVPVMNVPVNMLPTRELRNTLAMMQGNVNNDRFGRDKSSNTVIPARAAKAHPTSFFLSKLRDKSVCREQLLAELSPQAAVYLARLREYLHNMKPEHGTRHLMVYYWHLPEPRATYLNDTELSLLLYKLAKQPPSKHAADNLYLVFSDLRALNHTIPRHVWRATILHMALNPHLRENAPESQDLDEVVELVREMSREHTLDSSLLNTIIATAIHMGRVDKAEMLKDTFKKDYFMFRLRLVNKVHLLGAKGDSEGVCAAILQRLERGARLDIRMANLALTGLARSGSSNMVKNLFDILVSKTHMPPVTTNPAEAELLRRIRVQNALKPDHCTYRVLARTLAAEFFDYERAITVLRHSMADKNMQTSRAVFTHLFRAFASCPDSLSDEWSLERLESLLVDLSESQVAGDISLTIWIFRAFAYKKRSRLEAIYMTIRERWPKIVTEPVHCEFLCARDGMENYPDLLPQTWQHDRVWDYGRHVSTSTKGDLKNG